MKWLRVSIFACSFLGSLVFSPWIAVIGILALSLRWRAYEALFLALFMDFFWSPVGHVPFFTLGAVAVVWLLEPIRREFLR